MSALDDITSRLDTANGHLSDIDTHAQATTAAVQAVDSDVQTVNTSVRAVDTDVQATTTAVVAVGTDVQATTAAVQAVDTDVQYTNKLLTYQIEQNDTIICYLAKIAWQTCALLNEAALQTAAQQAMRRDLDDLKQLYELANPAAAVEQHRLEALKDQIERCCPPPKPEPPCRFEKCEQPGAVPPPPQPPSQGPPVTQVTRKAKPAG